MSQNLLKGWKQNITDDGHTLLFKLYETGSLSRSVAALDKIKELVLANKNAEYVGFTLSNDFLTVTLNNLGKNELVGQFIILANEIDKLLA